MRIYPFRRRYSLLISVSSITRREDAPRLYTRSVSRNVDKSKGGLLFQYEDVKVQSFRAIRCFRCRNARFQFDSDILEGRCIGKYMLQQIKDYRDGIDKDCDQVPDFKPAHVRCRQAVFRICGIASLNQRRTLAGGIGFVEALESVRRPSCPSLARIAGAISIRRGLRSPSKSLMISLVRLYLGFEQICALPLCEIE